jgi:hypothetical protein
VSNELTALRSHLASQGAPDALLRILDEARDVEDARRRFAESGLIPSAQDAIAGLVNGFRPLLEPGSGAVEAELCGAQFLGMLRGRVPEADLPEMLSGMIDQAAQSRAPQALAMLRVLAVSAPPEQRIAAAEAADGLVAAGLKDRPWVRSLGNPRVGTCFGYSDGAQSCIAITFAYGRTSHAFVVLIDHDLGGGVKDCFPTDRPDAVRAEYRQVTKHHGLGFHDYTPDEARAILERALASSPCPVEPDQIDDVHVYLDLLRRRVALLRGGATTPTKSVHRVKVTLAGSKPPIWRRLEVPSDVTLYRLHGIIQAAFAWENYHLWVFETAAGPYGPDEDRELGYRNPSSRKLADVAPRADDRMVYVYDYGDYWDHEIRVEEVVSAEPDVRYPRVLTGRRAGPPEDCGGLGGYAHLCEIIADPDHDEHRFRLDWLGLDSAAEFDPAAFDLDAVTKRVAKGVKVLRRS